MSLPILFDDRDLAAEFPIALLGDACLAFEPGVEAAAHMQDVHARPGERGQIVQRLLFRQIAAQQGVLAVDATDLSELAIAQA